MNKEEAQKKIKVLEKELNELKIIINKSKDIFDIITYKEVCKELNEKEHLLENFSVFGKNNIKMFNIAKLEQISRFYNQGWFPNWKDNNEQKHYPYFDCSGGGFRFWHSGFRCHDFYGMVFYYKNQQISDFVGKTYIDIYQQIQ